MKRKREIPIAWKHFKKNQRANWSYMQLLRQIFKDGQEHKKTSKSVKNLPQSSFYLRWNAADLSFAKYYEKWPLLHMHIHLYIHKRRIKMFLLYVVTSVTISLVLIIVIIFAKKVQTNKKYPEY